MSRKSSQHKLAAECIEMVYGYPGELLPKWEAEQIDKDSYRIYRPNGTTRDISLHTPTRGHGGDFIPYRHDNGCLVIGTWNVLIGRNLRHDRHARKLSRNNGNAYLIFNENMKNMGTVEIGQRVSGSPVSLVDGHLLKVGEDIIPIRPKKHDLTLLIYKTEYEDGLLSYFNFIEVGNINNREDGARGEFVRPKHDGEPALFIENFQGHKVTTALFWIDPKGNRVKYQSRDAQSALIEKSLLNQVNEAKAVAIRAGIEPTEYHEYVEVHDKYLEIQKKWRHSNMGFIAGDPDYFRAKSIGTSLER